MPDAIFAIPGDVRSPTGGYEYDRRVMALLPSFGVDIRHVELPSSFPHPSADDLMETQRLLGSTPRGATLLIDGLAFGAIPETMIRSLDRRIVALVHHPLGFETGLSEREAENLKDLEAAALSRAEKIIVTSEATLGALERDFKVARTKITVAEPGTDPAPRATGTGMPVQLLAVGAVSPRKGFDLLIEALATLKREDWRLTIAGATDRHPNYHEKLVSLAERKGLSDRIVFAGKVVPATLDRLYDSADLFIMSSHYEGYGMALAEALMRGLPLVCTTTGAASFMVPDAAALKVPPGNAVALSAALARTIADKKLRKRMADAAWEAGRQLPTWHETARRVAAVILGLDPQVRA